MKLRGCKRRISHDLSLMSRTLTSRIGEDYPFNIEYCSNIASILLRHFHHFREYCHKVNKHVCKPEAILLDTHDFGFSIAIVKSYISAIHGCNTTAILVQDLATREKCQKCITDFFYIFVLNDAWNSDFYFEK